MARRSSGSSRKRTGSKTSRPAPKAAAPPPPDPAPPAGELAAPSSAPAPAGPPEAPGFTRVHIWQIQALRDILVVAVFAAVIWIGYLLRAVTVPLLVALLLAYLFEPLIERLCRHPKIKRVTAVTGLLGVVIAGLLIVLALLIPLLVGQALLLSKHVQDGTIRGQLAEIEPYIPAAYEGLKSAFDLFPAGDGIAGAEGVAPADDGAAEPLAGPPAPLTEERVAEIVAEAMRATQQPPDERPEGWLDMVRNSAATVFKVIGFVVSVGLLSFLIPFYFFFFSLWYPSVVRFLRNLIPQRNKARTLELLGKMDQVVSGFVRGRITISLIMGLLLAVGWMLCGVPYAVVLGLVTGVFCAIPYLGALGVPVAIGLLLFKEARVEDHSEYWYIWAVAWPFLVFLIVQFIEGYLLLPRIAGKATNLDPVTIIVAVLAGGSVAGVYGMILAIPVAACLKILFTDVLLPKIRAWTEGRAADFLPIDRE